MTAEANEPALMEGPAPVEVVKKVLIIGDHDTGKTCLVRKFVHGIFEPSMKATLGVDFSTKVITQKDKRIVLQIWDIAGQEQYGQMTHIYYQSAVGALVVCDIMRPESFDGAIKWKQDLDSKVSLGKSSKPVPALLLVNKCDKSKLRKTKEEMDALCKEHGFIGWYETSAKDNINVSTAFLRLVDTTLNEKIEGATAEEKATAQAQETRRSVTLVKPPPLEPKPSSSCCGSSKSTKKTAHGQSPSLANRNGVRTPLDEPG